MNTGKVLQTEISKELLFQATHSVAKLCRRMPPSRREKPTTNMLRSMQKHQYQYRSDRQNENGSSLHLFGPEAASATMRLLNITVASSSSPLLRCSDTRSRMFSMSSLAPPLAPAAEVLIRRTPCDSRRQKAVKTTSRGRTKTG